MTTATRNRELAEAEIEDQLVKVKIAEIMDSGDHGFSTPEWFKASGELGEIMNDPAVGGSNMMAVRSTNYEYVTLYASDTGVTSSVPRNMIEKQLQKRLKDGRRAFSLTPVELVHGMDLKCRLHAEAEDRAYLDSIGLAGRSCDKDNIPSDFELAQHMRLRHKREWETIESDRTRRERDEDRALQREQIEAMRQATAGRKGS